MLHFMPAQPEWLAWFESTLVEPFPTGLIKEVDSSVYLGSPVENITAPGMLYDSNIMFLGDVRVTRRRSMPQQACPYFEDLATSEWSTVSETILPLVDIQLQNGYGQHLGDPSAFIHRRVSLSGLDFLLVESSHFGIICPLPSPPLPMQVVPTNML